MLVIFLLKKFFKSTILSSKFKLSDFIRRVRCVIHVTIMTTNNLNLTHLLTHELDNRPPLMSWKPVQKKKKNFN